MKSFIAAIVIFIGLIAGGFFSVWHIENIADDMSERNERITKAVEEEDFETAKKEVSGLSDYVEDKKAVLSSTMDHSYVDNIEMNICELERYVDGEVKYDSLAKCEVLHMLFEHLPKNYKLKPENIF